MPSRGLYFDRQGRPIDLDRFGELHDDPDYVRVGLDVYPSLEFVAGEGLPAGHHLMTISTVWLGINHGFMSPAPVIFETMIFGGAYDRALTRYHSEADAMRGHQLTVEDLQHGRVPWFMVGDDERERAE